ncbi:MAG: S-layer homology domain-containing protein [Clostridiales bacterium]|jgi:hypothetical protein|nr:S-layer homology domain-containing protein [Clostridiales bacterium]
MKRSLSIALVLSLIVVMGFALAAGGGPGDPLISLTYIRDTFIPAVLKSAEVKLNDETAELRTELSQRLDEISGTGIQGYQFSSGYKTLSFQKGGTLTISEMTGFILTEGYGNIRIERGEVIDLNTGKSIPADCILEKQHRYFTAEGASAVIRIYSSTADGMVDGYYLSESSGTIPANLMFMDIPATHWANESITYLAGRDIIKGVGNDRYAPNDFVTRGAFVTILGRIYNIDSSLYQTSRFVDVDMSLWYGPYIAWADEMGIVTGYGNEMFGPNDVITREQMAVIIMNYADFAGVSLPVILQPGAFNDQNEISGWALDAVKAAQTAGIITGKTGNLFDPKGTAIRSEISAVTYRFLGYAGLRF